MLDGHSGGGAGPVDGRRFSLGISDFRPNISPVTPNFGDFMGKSSLAAMSPSSAGEFASPSSPDGVPSSPLRGARLRHQVRDAALEFELMRRQLGRARRSRRALREQLCAAREVDAAVGNAVGRAREDCRRWAEDDLPGMLARLDEEERDAAALNGGDRLDVPALRQASEFQSRRLEFLALRCAGLERRVALQRQDLARPPEAEAAPSEETPTARRLAELDGLQLELLRERSAHQRKVLALQAELSELRLAQGGAAA